MAFLSLGYAIPLIFMSAIVATESILLWIMFIKYKKLQTYNNGFLLSLSLSDFLIGSVYNTIYLFQPEMIDGYLTGISLMVNVLNILSLSIERHYAVTKPFRYKIHIKKLFYGLVSSSWLVAIGISLIPLAWNTDLSTIQHKIFLICYMIIPVAVIVASTILYIRILKTIQRRNQFFAQHAANNLPSQHFIEKQRLLNEWKITKVIIIITVVFAGAWLPMLYMTICSLSGNNRYIPRNLSQWAMLTLVLHSIINPLIYSFMKSDIRDVIMTSARSIRCFTALTRQRVIIPVRSGSFSPPAIEFALPNEERDFTNVALRELTHTSNDNFPKFTRNTHSHNMQPGILIQNNALSSTENILMSDSTIN